MKKSNNIKFFSLCLVAALGLSGCDFIKTVKEYFLGEEKPQVSSPAALVKSEEGVVQDQAQTKAQVPAAEKNANVLARVGTWTISSEEFQQRLDALKEMAPEYDLTDLQTKRMVLEELINQQLLVVEAEKAGIAQKKDVVEAVEEFRRTLIMREVVQQLTKDLQVTEEEAQAFYDQNKESMVGEAQWHVREIVVPMEEDAKAILAEILKGADFAQMARDRSMSKTAAEGGDMGFITSEPFEQMGKALVFMKPGDVSSVFDGPDGFYIVKLEEKTGGEPIKFEDIKEEIMQGQILLKQQQAVFDHLKELKDQTPIEINEQLLP